MSSFQEPCAASETFDTNSQHSGALQRSMSKRTLLMLASMGPNVDEFGIRHRDPVLTKGWYNFRKDVTKISTQNENTDSVGSFSKLQS